MFNNKRILGIVPARSGSKGLKDKNIKLLNGKPLLSYTIESAMKSQVFDTIFVSTDSERYAEVAREYGAEVPELRPESFAGDNSRPSDYIDHALSVYKKKGIEFDYYVILQPTSPLRSHEDIKNAVDIAISENKVQVVSVCEAEHSPRICNVLPDSHSLDHFIDKEDNKNRQELGKYYRINGAIYIVELSSRSETLGMYGEESKAYIMPRERSVDIDTELDFLFAEFLINKKNRSSLKFTKWNTM